MCAACNKQYEKQTTTPTTTTKTNATRGLGVLCRTKWRAWNKTQKQCNQHVRFEKNEHDCVNVQNKRPGVFCKRNVSLQRPAQSHQLWWPRDTGLALITAPWSVNIGPRCQQLHFAPFLCLHKTSADLSLTPECRAVGEPCAGKHLTSNT